MKKKILTLIIQQQEEIITNLQKSVDTYISTTDLDEESTRDLDDMSHQAEAQKIQNEISTQLNHAKTELNQLKSFLMKENQKVERGALVETDTQFLVVGIPISPFIAEGKHVLGFSTAAPAFPVNEGKTKGDTLQLGNNNFEILEIY